MRTRDLKRLIADEGKILQNIQDRKDSILCWCFCRKCGIVERDWRCNKKRGGVNGKDF